MTDETIAPPHPQRRTPTLFGRTRGKKLRGVHSGLMAALLPALSIDVSLPIDPATLFGAPVDDLWLEIGFGGGEHLAQEALAHPQIGHIGAEPFVNGVAKALALIAEHDLKNVRLHAGDAGAVIDALPAASLGRVYLLYPDPWPKRRQLKRRFVSDAMLTRLARVMRPGAELRFATDIDDYAGWTLARVQRSSDFEWRAQSAADWMIAWEGWQATRYEDKARREGRRSAYLTFVRR